LLSSFRSASAKYTTCEWTRSWAKKSATSYAKRKRTKIDEKRCTILYASQLDLQDLQHCPEHCPANGESQTFLLSWHHLDAYISRLDVSDAYLESLAFDSQTLDGRPTVKRTHLLSLKDPSERIQLATHTAEILLFLLAQFRSCLATAIHLRDSEAD